MSARVSLWLLVLAASTWAGSLGLSGVWVLTEWSARFPVFRWPCWVGGATLVAMGQFVFAYLVADRVFPRAHVGMRAGLQVTAGVVFVGGLVILACWRMGLLRL